MTEKPQGYPVQEIVSYMTESLTDPRAGVVSRAFFFLEAIRKFGADLPDVVQTAQIIRALTLDVAALISLPEISGFHRISTLDAKPEDSAMLIFSDLSACWFKDTGQMSEIEFVNFPQSATYEQNFPLGISSRVIALSPEHIALYGAPEGGMFQDAGPESRSLREEMLEELHDLIDPPVDFGNMPSEEQDWTDDESAALEDLITSIWLGLQVTFTTETTIHAKAGSASAEVEITAGEADDTGHKLRAMEAFEICLRALQDLDDFEGYEYVFIGEPSERMSGYAMSALTVVSSLEFDPEFPQASNHEVLSAPGRLRQSLRAAGKDAAWINHIFDLARPDRE